MPKRLKQILSGSIPTADLTGVYNSYDIVGDIAIIRLEPKPVKHRASIAETIMAVHMNVKTVLEQEGAVHGDFRLRKLTYLAGQKKTATLHNESGCTFKVDVEQCYFSPRLSNERMRIAEQVRKGEIVVNMFAGVGCFSILIAKHSEAERVYSIDLNPDAIGYAEENVRLNKVYGRVMPILGDAKEVIEGRLRHVADRVLMPLPEKASEYLPLAILALTTKGGRIHYYDFEHAANEAEAIVKLKARVSDRLRGLDVAHIIVSGRVVRSTGPRWCQVVLDIDVQP